MKDEKETIENALFDAINISRWNQNDLTDGEIHLIIDNIFEELEKIGYEIKKK